MGCEVGKDAPLFVCLSLISRQLLRCDAPLPPSANHHMLFLSGTGNSVAENPNFECDVVDIFVEVFVATYFISNQDNSVTPYKH